MFDKILQLNDEEKNLLIFSLIQKLAKYTKLDQELVLNCLLNDTDAFMQIHELFSNLT